MDAATPLNLPLTFPPHLAKPIAYTPIFPDLLEQVALRRYDLALDKNSWMNGYRSRTLRKD